MFALDHVLGVFVFVSASWAYCICSEFPLFECGVSADISREELHYSNGSGFVFVRGRVGHAFPIDLGVCPFLDLAFLCPVLFQSCVVYFAQMVVSMLWTNLVLLSQIDHSFDATLFGVFSRGRVRGQFFCSGVAVHIELLSLCKSVVRDFVIHVSLNPEWF